MSSEPANLEYVGFWPRVGAFVVDSILVMLIVIPILELFYGGVIRGSGLDLSGLPDLSRLQDLSSRDLEALAATQPSTGPSHFLLTLVLPALAAIAFWIARGATPGKMLIGARVVDARTGGKLSTSQAITRYLGYYVSLLPLGLGLLWVGIDSRKQGWHDKIAGTVVVRPQGGRRVSFPQASGPTSPQP